jgi:outer membrane protein
MTAIRRLLTLSFVALLAPLAIGQDAKLSIATVDMQVLFKEYYRYHEAQSQVDVERARVQKENNERLTRIRALEETLGKLRKQVDDPSLNDSKKQTLFKEWQMQQQEGIALDRERTEFLQRRTQALNEKMVQRVKGILEEIRKLVEEKSKGDSYDYVFDKSGLTSAGIPFLLYTKDATDITPSLLKILNKDAPADFKPKSAETKPEIADPLATPAKTGSGE